MNCDRLVKLIKTWYLQVQGETMAPARMVSFMNQHITECEECLADPMVKEEVEKVRGIVLPASKVPKKAEAEAKKDETTPAAEAEVAVDAGDIEDEKKEEGDKYDDADEDDDV